MNLVDLTLLLLLPFVNLRKLLRKLTYVNVVYSTYVALSRL